VVQNGTGSAVTLKRRVDVAGKTGTTSKNCDKWFVGYTPELLAGVWYGFEYPESLADVKGNPALNVFDDLMTRAVELREIHRRQFSTDENVIAVRYCKDSGKRMSQACQFDPRGDRSEVGYFKRGTEPTGFCDCHICVRYCDGGGVATDECPDECCHTTALIRVSRRFPRQIKVLDAPYTYVGPIDKKQQNISNNEPYYAQNYESKQYFGIGMGIVPYNRFCPGHEEDPFWERRFFAQGIA
jgi:membrane peptidoglycan carboxypeptidase